MAKSNSPPSSSTPAATNTTSMVAASIISNKYQFKGRKKFFCSIKQSGEEMPPAHYVQLGPVTFRQFSNPLTPMEEEKYRFVEMGPPVPGEFLSLNSDECRAVISALWNKGVRWNRNHKRADVVNFSSRQVSAPVAGSSLPYIYPLRKGDEPLAKFIVMIPASDMAAGDVQDPECQPSLLDQFPELGELKQEE